MNKLQIKNGRLVVGYQLIRQPINIADGKIVSIGGDFDPDIVIDADGAYVSPGFIDIHTHGGDNCDFMDSTEEAFFRAAHLHMLHGTTTLLPTLMSSDCDEIIDALRVFDSLKGKKHDGANLAGIHIEGPYFSPKQSGAQDTKFLRTPDPNEYMKILEFSDSIMRWSAAPELDLDFAFARELTSRGILPSIAHTDATYECVLDAFDAGYTHITHFYSSMSTVHRINAYRHAGVLEAGYLIDDMTVEIIADGCHLPASLLKFVTKFKSPEKVALVTDSMRGAGLPDGSESILGSLKKGQRVILEGGVAMLPDKTSFAGSIATADRLLRSVINMAGVSVQDAVMMASTTPAKIVGLSRKGQLKPDYDADIVIFDEDINIKATIIGGELKYSNK